MDMKMFGELEDAPEGRMVVRVLGHAIGDSDGWAHWSGLAVLFPSFTPSVAFLKARMQQIDKKELHLAIDYYSGEVKLLSSPPENSNTPEGAFRMHGQGFSLTLVGARGAAPRSTG